MAERGGVHRVNSFQSEQDFNQDFNTSLRSQDHFQKFTKLIAMELEDETRQLEKRWKTWTKKRLIESGLALFDLVGKRSGFFFDEFILTFKCRKSHLFPYHRFTHGDMVIISRSTPWNEKITEGIVMDSNPTRIRIVVKEIPSDLRKGGWRLDKGANRVAHDRMHDALVLFHSIESDCGTRLRDLLLGNTHDPTYTAELPPEMKNKGTKKIINNPLKLDPSQKKVVEKSLNRRLSLIQGPPGTGKTHTAVQLLKGMVSMKRGPILATAESNVAVDNLLQGLLENGINAVRIGRPIKVREKLRKATLDAIIAEHPLQDDINFIREEIELIRSNLKQLKGKERGLAHRDINQNKKEIQKMIDRIVSGVLDDAEVVCTTNIGAGHHILGTRKYPIVLIDEATQASEPSSLVPIVRGCRQLILVGDHKQLPPTIISQRAEENGLGVALFERLIKSNFMSDLLTTQYRMHPSIREFPSAQFYENLLNDGCKPEDRPPAAGFLWPDWDQPIAFIPINGSEIVEKDGDSKSNMDEASMVIQILKSLLQAGDILPENIGIISPYAGQVRLLKKLIMQDDNAQYSNLEIKTVDGYQGREKEVIVISTVRSNKNGNIGFLKDERRLNVAITRARRGLIIIGNDITLRHDPNWRDWLDWIKEKGLMAWHMIHT